MQYQIFTTSSGQRSLRKLPKHAKKPLLREIQKLRTQPRLGEQLKAEFRFLRSLHFKHGNIDYRVAYEIDDKTKEIAIRYADNRENFYKKLRRMKLKPLPH